MNINPRDLQIAAHEADAEAPAERGHAEWLSAQFQQAVLDLDDPKEEAIEHDEVFAELDRIICTHPIRSTQTTPIATHLD